MRTTERLRGPVRKEAHSTLGKQGPKCTGKHASAHYLALERYLNAEKSIHKPLVRTDSVLGPVPLLRRYMRHESLETSLTRASSVCCLGTKKTRLWCWAKLSVWGLPGAFRTKRPRTALGQHRVCAMLLGHPQPGAPVSMGTQRAEQPGDAALLLTDGLLTALVY